MSNQVCRTLIKENLDSYSNVDLIEKMYDVKVEDKIGEGTYGKVYKGIMTKNNTKVAIKVIKVDENRTKTDQEKQVVLQNRAHKIEKESSNLRVAPKVFHCDFICTNKDSRDICKGKMIIIMEKKKPITIANLSNVQLLTLCQDVLVNFLELGEANIYAFDTKIQNMVMETLNIDSEDNINFQVIDIDDKYRYTQNELENKSVLEYEDVFFTFMFVMFFTHLFYEISKKKGNENLDKIKDNFKELKTLKKKYKKYRSQLKHFIKHEEELEFKKDIRFRKTIIRYVLLNDSNDANAVLEKIEKYLL